MTFNVLEYARQQRIPIVFSSSREVYGDVHRFEEYGESIADFAYTESTYSASKIAGEAFIYSYARCYGLPYLVFRFSNVYGRYDNDLHRMVRVMPLFIHAMLRGEPITVYGGREKTLDFTYVDDCVDGIVRGIEALAEGRVVNQTINLAYGQGNTLVHVAERIASELGVEPDMTIAPSLLGEVTHYVADLSKAVTCWATTRKCPSTRASPARSPGSASIAKPIPRRTSPSRPTTRAAARTMSSTRLEDSPGYLALVAIFGPTASGKSAVAEAIAERVPAELVSADSMQVYRGLPILTNQDARARLVGIWPLDRQGTVGEFQVLAHEAIDEIVAAGRTAVVVGGSGLWFQAALTDVRLPDVPADAGRAGSSSTTGVARRPRTACCRLAIPVPQRRCIRTTASASCAPSSSGRRAERWCPRNRASGAPSCACRPSSPASRFRARPWRHGSASARQRCSSRAWRTRCGRQATSFPRCSASTRYASCHGPRRSPSSSVGRCASPPTSGSGCAASPASS